MAKISIFRSPFSFSILSFHIHFSFSFSVRIFSKSFFVVELTCPYVCFLRVCGARRWSFLGNRAEGTRTLRSSTWHASGWKPGTSRFLSEAGSDHATTPRFTGPSCWAFDRDLLQAAWYYLSYWQSSVSTIVFHRAAISSLFVGLLWSIDGAAPRCWAFDPESCLKLYRRSSVLFTVFSLSCGLYLFRGVAISCELTKLQFVDVSPSCWVQLRAVIYSSGRKCNIHLRVLFIPQRSLYFGPEWYFLLC